MQCAARMRNMDWNRYMFCGQIHGTNIKFNDNLAAVQVKCTVDGLSIWSFFSDFFRSTRSRRIRSNANKGLATKFNDTNKYWVRVINSKWHLCNSNCELCLALALALALVIRRKCNEFNAKHRWRHIHLNGWPLISHCHLVNLCCLINVLTDRS